MVGKDPISGPAVGLNPGPHGHVVSQEGPQALGRIILDRSKAQTADRVVGRLDGADEHLALVTAPVAALGRVLLGVLQQACLVNRAKSFNGLRLGSTIPRRSFASNIQAGWSAPIPSSAVSRRAKMPLQWRTTSQAAQNQIVNSFAGPESSGGQPPNAIQFS